MDAFGFPQDWDEGMSLLPHAIIALLVGISILLYKNSRFTGSWPGSADEWEKMIGRLLALIAALFLIIPPGPLSAVLGLFAALLLVCNKFFERHLRIVAAMSLTALLLPIGLTLLMNLLF